MHFLKRLKNYFLILFYRGLYWFKFLPGRLSYTQIKLPDFIIIGAPKCGSTFLFETLNTHPQIKGASLKEPQYFNLNYKRGERYYRGFFPLKKDGFFTGEASVNYFYSTEAAKRIKQDLPQVKLILLLRNPVDRAYSHFQMNKGNLKQKDFNQLIESENAENKRFGFVEKGNYAKYLENWITLFSKDQLLILKSEALFKDPQLEMQKVLQHIGVQSHDFENLKAINSRKYSKIDVESSKKLKAYYRKDGEKLVNLLGEKFKWN